MSHPPSPGTHAPPRASPPHLGAQRPCTSLRSPPSDPLRPKPLTSPWRGTVRIGPAHTAMTRLRPATPPLACACAVGSLSLSSALARHFPTQRRYGFPGPERTWPGWDPQRLLNRPGHNPAQVSGLVSPPPPTHGPRRQYPAQSPAYTRERQLSLVLRPAHSTRSASPPSDPARPGPARPDPSLSSGSVAPTSTVRNSRPPSSPSQSPA